MHKIETLYPIIETKSQYCKILQIDQKGAI